MATGLKLPHEWTGRMTDPSGTGIFVEPDQRPMKIPDERAYRESLLKERDRDLLKNIFAMQRDLLARYDEVEPLTLAIGIMTEAAEVTEEVGWKPWKPAPRDKTRVLEELVDVVHFVVGLAIRLGVGAEEFHAAYSVKNRYNHGRADHKGRR